MISACTEFSRSTVHTLLAAMYAKAPYTVISRAVHIHPTVAAHCSPGPKAAGLVGSGVLTPQASEQSVSGSGPRRR